MDKSGETILRIRKENKELREELRELKRQTKVLEEIINSNNIEINNLRKRK